MSDTKFLEVLLSELMEWSREASVNGDTELAKSFREDAKSLEKYINSLKKI